MDPKTTVVKSKSNAGVSNKRDKQKSTKSNAEFHPLNMKKRGVYVENKDEKLIDINENNDAEIRKKPPPRPRPGQKGFLTSVLNILSKSTTGTQYPDSEQIRGKRKTNKNQISNQDKATSDYYTETNNKKKPKYKSKILNGDSYNSFNDKFIVLQPKKDIVHTPSNFSENCMFNESNNPIREVLQNNIYSGVAEGLAKEILEGRTETPVTDPEDPLTLVANPKDDSKIYKFFVDLIETTFDVYNVETEQTKSKDSIMVIEETVAKKLNFNMDLSEKEESHEHDLNFKIQEDTIYEPNYTDEIPKAKKKSPKRYLHSRSFVYAQPIPKSNSLVIKKKPQTKKSKKNELLTKIKEELKIDFMTYEEPQNLFQALRNMAKYKRKCSTKTSGKTIHFEHNNSNIVSECVFSRDIFSVKRVSKRKNRKGKNKVERAAHSVAKIVKAKRDPVINISNHSLKVFGIEYENDDDERFVSSSSNVTEVGDFNGTFGFSATSLDVKGFYSLLQE